MKAPAAEQQAPSSPWPPSARGHVLSPEQTKQKGARLKALPPRAHYPDRRIVTSVGLTLRRAWWVRDIDQSRQRGKSPNHPLTESPDSTKVSGATVGYHD